MQRTATKYERIKALPWLYVFTFWSILFVFLSCWGPVFSLFLRSCGLSISQVGIISSIIPFIGVLAIFIGNYIGRFGAKKITISAIILRTLVFASLIPLPFLLSKISTDTIFFWIFGVILVFSIFRMFSDTAYSEWMGELIPDERRGRTDAITVIVVGSVATLSLASVALLSKISSDIKLFGFIFIAACIAGLLSAATLLKLPCGGAKISTTQQNANFLINTLKVLKDKNFVLFLVANNVTFFYWSGLATFLPIFLREQISFSQSNVFLMEMWLRLASIFTCFLWGWCADRFGSKPVMMTGIYGFLFIPLPFLFASILPSESHIYIFAVVYIILGWILYAFVLGGNRYFYVKAAPKDASRVYYVTINFAVQSIMLGISPLIGGVLIDSFKYLQNKTYYGVELSPYTPFFVMLIFSIIIAIIAGKKLVPDGAIGTGRFLSMFIEGNPFTAFGNIMRFHRSFDEELRLTATKQLGDSGTRLGISDLLMALKDPSFNVRYEAVLALSHLPFDNQVLEALKQVLYSEEPDLSELAGWVLGRRGDERAIGPLRYMLKNGRYALLRARCARSLANLNDIESAKEILEQFRKEQHISIKVAYAAALGKMKLKEAFNEIEGLLTTLTETSMQGEVALAIARILGMENHFVRLWRKVAAEEISLGLTEYIIEINRKYEENNHPVSIKDLLEKASDLFAIGSFIEGTKKLIESAEKILAHTSIQNEMIKKIMERAIFVLTNSKEIRYDYLILLIISIEYITVYELKTTRE